MRKNKLKQMFKEGKPIINGWLQIPSAFSAEKELGMDNQLLIIGLPALNNSLNLFFLIRMKCRNEYILHLSNL